MLADVIGKHITEAIYGLRANSAVSAAAAPSLRGIEALVSASLKAESASQ